MPLRMALKDVPVGRSVRIMGMTGIWQGITGSYGRLLLPMVPGGKKGRGKEKGLKQYEVRASVCDREVEVID